MPEDNKFNGSTKPIAVGVLHELKDELLEYGFDKEKVEVAVYRAIIKYCNREIRMIREA
jgi:hypothetical protein